MNTMFQEFAKTQSMRSLKWTAIYAVALSAFVALHFDMPIYSTVCAILIGITAATKVE